MRWGWFVHNLHPCHPGLFKNQLIVPVLGAGTCHLYESFCSLQNPCFPITNLLFWALTWKTMIFTPFCHIYKSIYMSFPHTSGSLIFQLFKFNLLGWHWFAKSYRFQVYNSRKHLLHTASYAHHTRQSLFPSPFPPYPPPPTYPLSAGHRHTVVCVYVICIYVFLINPFTFHPILPPKSCQSVPCTYVFVYISCQFILFIRFHVLVYQITTSKEYMYLYIHWSIIYNS